MVFLKLDEEYSFSLVRKDLIDNPVNLDSEVVKDSTIHLNGSTSLKKYKNVLDNLLEKSVDEKYYLSERIKPTILSNGSKNLNLNRK